MSTDIQTRVAPRPDERIFYGKDPSQFGDLRLPGRGGLHPLAVVLHGGWWHSEANLEYLGHLASALTDDGIATWNLEFRRLGETGGGWPATFLDVAAGADYMRKLAAIYAIDLTRVVVVGHSAGGHLAMWLAARHRIPRQSPLYSVPAVPLCGAMSIAGAVDLRMAQASGFRDGFVNRLVVEDLLGGTPDEVPERYDAASPAELLPLGIPQALLHGSADDIAPFAITESYVRRAQALGDDATLVRIEGADHFDPLDPESTAFRHVRTALQTLLGGRKHTDPQSEGEAIHMRA